ncbi:hypothetical protein [Flavobacterium sp. H4147]|uniref:hypothetical protein n=1 Tax=Flavobacterium sp. H4147 TaxID=3034149 RepID=UPI0023EC02CB|nr:hypothetical protein [Flavobacterium sp. H4147]
MKRIQQKKSGVLKVMLVLMFAAFFISCSNDSSENQNAQLSNTEQQNQPNTQKYLPHYEGFIVRAWGAHNIDCSQPDGFCNFVYYDWITYGFGKPTSDGTPVRVANEKGNFVMEIQKSALTPEHQRVLLRNGDVYVIPEGQIIQPELVKSLKFSSDILVPGKYRIQESEESYTISINVK